MPRSTRPARPWGHERGHFLGNARLLPVALTCRDIREKIIGALIAANGKTFKNHAALDQFVDTALSPSAAPLAATRRASKSSATAPSISSATWGSGARPLGQAKMAQFGVANPQTYHIFISHLHWDHLMGFPYFAPMYIPATGSSLHGCHPSWKSRSASRCRPLNFPESTTHRQVPASSFS